jgi:hypothetical protein
MTKVDFSRTTDARGRNGMMYAVALDVYRPTVGRTIGLGVYTARGRSDSIIIEIPIEDIPAVIAALQKEVA